MVFSAYFIVVLLIGIATRTRWKSTPENYFLADRKLGTLVLLGTMVATNFSAFTVFGASGAGYRDGYAFFPIMGFGTGFMAITFWILGRKIWEIGRSHGVVTPPELIRYLYGNRALSFVFAMVMIIFTIPYLALQPMAAGYALEALLGLPYFFGCILVTVIIVLYTLRGGMRAVAWTDLFQGSVMFVMLLASLIVVVQHHGGLSAANQKILSLSPELFSRPGGTGKYSPGIWLSFMLLWFFCDPMFPQLFQRFFTARSQRTISRIMLLYPLVCTVVFIMPIAIGVIGRLSIPDLVGKDADRILPLLMTHLSGDVMATLVIAAGMAALMSTMDSQLLTLSSIFTRDILPLLRRKASEGTVTGRLFVIFLSLAGLALAYRPPATILQIATQTFTGLAVLFPTVIFGLYFKRRYARAGDTVHPLWGDCACRLLHEMDANGWFPVGGMGHADNVHGLPADSPLPGMAGRHLRNAYSRLASFAIHLPAGYDFYPIHRSLVLGENRPLFRRNAGLDLVFCGAFSAADGCHGSNDLSGRSPLTVIGNTMRTLFQA